MWLKGFVVVVDSGIVKEGGVGIRIFVGGIVGVLVVFDEGVVEGEVVGEMSVKRRLMVMMSKE